MKNSIEVIENKQDESEFWSKLPAIPSNVLLKTLIKENQHRRTFTKEEDARLIYLVNHFGNNEWGKIAELMPYRSLRQCKERYIGYLSPSINHDEFTPEEDLLIIEKYEEYGSKWTKISKFLKGRCGNQIKNRYNIYLKNKTKEKIKSQIQEKNKKVVSTDDNFEISDIPSRINDFYFNEIEDEYQNEEFDDEYYYLFN